MSARTIDLRTLSKGSWHNVDNTEERCDSFWFRYPGSVTVLTVTKLIFPVLDSATGEWITLESSPMLPHYYDEAVMSRELEKLSNGASQTELVPILSVGGAGDNISARTPIADEWLQVVVVSADCPNEEQPTLEVLWWSWGRIKGRYRTKGTPPVDKAA